MNNRVLGTQIHPLDRLAYRVQYSGWYFGVVRRMQRLCQPVILWSGVLLITSCSHLHAPFPFKVTGREYIYLDPRDPSSISLANSDPSTFRLDTKIDLTKVPDIP